MNTPTPHAHELIRIAELLRFELALLDGDTVVAATPAARDYLSALSAEGRQALSRGPRGESCGSNGSARAQPGTRLEVFAFESPLGRVLLFAGPAFPRRPTAHGLRLLYGLTPAEARVACALAAQETPKEVAYRLGVELSTVRTQLRSIQAKLGASSQTDLVRRLLWSAATYVPEIQTVCAAMSEAATRPHPWASHAQLDAPERASFAAGDAAPHASCTST